MNILWNKYQMIVFRNFLLPLLLFAVSFIFRYIALLQTDYGNGWDAYYYLIQIKALLTEGSMHSQDFSIIYPFILLFKIFISDFIIAYKVAASTISGLYVLSLYLISKEVTKDKNNYLNYILVTAFALFSPTITYMASQFPKNLLGLVMLNFFLLFWIKDKRWAIILFFLLTFFTHRLTAGIICIFVVFQLFYKRRFIWLGITLIAIFVLSYFLPGLIHFYDIERFSNTFSVKPQFAPLSFIQLTGIEKISYFWIAEIIISILFFLTAIVTILFYRNHIRTFLKKFFLLIILICIVLLFPFFIFDFNGPAFRFFLTFLCIYPLFILIINDKIHNVIKISFTGILIIASFFSFRSYSPEKFDPPYNTYEQLIIKTTTLLKDKKPDIIIAHKGLAEFFTYSTGMDALAWQPESRFSLEKTWRISSGISMSDYKFYLNQELTDSIKKVGIDYFLLPETIWQEFVNYVEENDALQLTNIVRSEKNPYKIRPAYLKKRKTKKQT